MYECRTAEEVREHYRQVRARTNLWRAPVHHVDSVDSQPHADEVPAIEPVQIEIVEVAQETEVTIHRQEAEPQNVVVHPSIARIANIVAAKFNVTRADIVSHRRTMNVVKPRQITMYLARTLTLRSLPEIGYYLGDRDHTTILFGVRKITRLRASDPELDALLSGLAEQLGAA